MSSENCEHDIASSFGPLALRLLRLIVVDVPELKDLQLLHGAVQRRCLHVAVIAAHFLVNGCRRCFTGTRLVR